MNWDAIGAIGEVIGAFAVVFSLAYLAIQIRVSNKTAIRSSNQEVIGHYLTTYAQISSSIEQSDTFMRGLANDETLTFQEKVHFRLLIAQNLIVLENIYHVGLRNELDTWLVENAAYILKQLAGAPGFQEYVLDRKEQFSKGFLGVLEKEIEQSEPYLPTGIVTT